LFTPNLSFLPVNAPLKEVNSTGIKFITATVLEPPTEALQIIPIPLQKSPFPEVQSALTSPKYHPLEVLVVFTVVVGDTGTKVQPKSLLVT
jgi:hypothetical protein